MVYVNTFLLAIAGAMTAAVLWIGVSFVLPFYVPILVGRLLNRGGTSAAVISSGSILLAALIGFVVAGWWGLHRLSAAH